MCGRQVVKENEFLLTDGNALHEDLKKIVSELEKMQEKYRKVCDDNKHLQDKIENLEREQSAVNIAGKVWKKLQEINRQIEET